MLYSICCISQLLISELDKVAIDIYMPKLETILVMVPITTEDATATKCKSRLEYTRCDLARSKIPDLYLVFVNG